MHELKPDENFDLVIFDEAHKTAGREGVHFGFALSDKNLAIKKRLFLTATPRHYDLRKRDREGDARLVYFMDAPEIYGPYRPPVHLRRSRPPWPHLPLPGHHLRGHCSRMQRRRRK